MGKRGPKEIEYLFNLYSSNLSMHSMSYQNVFACPICLRIFPHSAIQSGALDRAHIIPEKMGGKLKTLTCKDCNSRLGYLADHHLIAQSQAEDKLVGKSDKPLRGHLIVGEGKIAADLYLSNKSVKIKGIPEQSNPKMSQIIQRELDAGTKEFSISANLNFKDVPSRVAILSSAYLMMFLYFGYGYIKYKIAEPLRRQLREPDTEMDVLQGIVNLGSLPSGRSGVTIVQEPKNLRCFMVVLDLSTKAQRFVGVVLPGLDSDSETIYERWRSIDESLLRGLKSRISIISRNPEFISNPDAKEVCGAFWTHVR